MTAPIQTIFFDVGNTLRIVLPDQEFMDKVTDIVLVRAGKDKEFRKKLRKRLKK